MTGVVPGLIAAALALTPTSSAAAPKTGDVLLVHGAVMQASSWDAVQAVLKKRGYRVRRVELPLTSLQADIAVVQKALSRQRKPVVLVGHSYGGAVITAAGDHPTVKALVYVAGLAPDRGETIGELNARWPLPAHLQAISEQTVIVEPFAFKADLAADLPDATVEKLASTQRPTAVALFSTKMPEAAWRTKPSYGLVAKQDRTLAPDMLRFLYKRAGAEVVEVDASHLVQISQPEVVADLVQQASRQGAKE